MDPKLEKLLVHPQSDIRSDVIDHAVKIEFLINSLLTRIFACENNESISFGSSSSSLSFMAKINLLLDLKVLTKDEKKKLVLFAEIRNKFAHDFMVMSANDLPDQSKKDLKKFYAPNEDNNFNSFNLQLYYDVKDIVDKLINTVIDKAGKKASDLGLINYNNILFDLVKTYSEKDKDFSLKMANLINKATEIYNQTPLPDDIIDQLPLL